MYKKFDDEDVEYITTTETEVINGKIYTIINRHPVLEPEEKERRHQEFLRVADRILREYENEEVAENTRGEVVNGCGTYDNNK